MPESFKKDPDLASFLSGSIFGEEDLSAWQRKDEETRQNFINELQASYNRGEDISEYVWPHEWELRQRPKPHFSNHIISLADAIELCGEHFHEDQWRQDIWYARPPEEIDRWKPEDRICIAFYDIGKSKGADFSNQPDKEKHAYDLKRDIYGKLSTWLNQGKIEAFTLDDEGNQTEIPKNTWLSYDATRIMDRGTIYEKENGQVKINGKTDFVYLNKESLEMVLKENKKRNNKKVWEDLKPDGVNCPEGVWILKAALLKREHDRNPLNDDGKKMGEIIQDFINFLLLTPELEIFTIKSYSGEKEKFDRDLLRSRSVADYFLKGFIPYSEGFHSSKKDGQYIFVNKEQFDKVLAGESLSDESNEIVSHELPEQVGYTPAYIEFMLKAAKALELSASKRVNASQVETWLDENWPKDLEGKSDRIIKSMVTLLRRPEDKKGGNTSWK